jgi:hypothetical protein
VVIATSRAARLRAVAFSAAVVCGALTVGTAQQMIYSSGQTVAPAFEGWEKNEDGTFNMVFAYFNRNLDEHVHVPIGPNNRFESGNPDQGQPTYFYPRRNRFHFMVKVPADFGKKELVWSLTTYGSTEKAYATLLPEYVIDSQLAMLDVGNFGRDPEGRELLNKPPVLKLEGAAERRVAVGQPLSLAGFASDDGMPKLRPAPPGVPGSPRGRSNALGLRVAFFVYRGDGADVTFDPAQFKIYPDYRIDSNSPWSPRWTPPPLPADGRHAVTVRFKKPGTYVIRAQAHDGGLTDHQDITVTVTP